MALDPTAADDRHSQMLAQLAAMTFTLARELSNRATEADSNDEAVKLAAAFHQVSRGLRQTLALEMKLIRFKAELAKEAASADYALLKQAQEAVRRREAERAERRQAFRERIEDAFWTEDEAPDWFVRPENAPEPPPRPRPGDPFWAKLAAFIDEAEARPDFLTRDFDIMVIEACEATGLDPNLLYEIHTRKEADLDPEPEPTDSS